MKYLISSVLLGLVIFGSYRLGKVRADKWWESEWWDAEYGRRISGHQLAAAERVESCVIIVPKRGQLQFSLDKQHVIVWGGTQDVTIGGCDFSEWPIVKAY